MTAKQKTEDIMSYKDLDIDELLAKLTTEQIEELHTELIDPDDSMVPPSDRCRYKTDKEPTCPFNRKKLLDYLEKKAREEKDWDEEKPYTKEKRGKVWLPKEEEKIQLHEDASISTEWDEILSGASEAELVDLAAILGFHGMLNQVQYHQAFVEGRDMKDGTGFQGVAKYTEFKVFEEEPPNETNVEESLTKLKQNDPTLTELNLNNIRDISIPKLCEIAESLEQNTHLVRLYLANTRATEKVAKAFAKVLEKNKTLKCLNLESNYVSGMGILAILEAININHILEELRVSNQRPQLLGVRNEMQMAQLVKDNKSLLKFGIFLEVRTARLLVSRYVQRNIDNLRCLRTGKDITLPPVEETPYYLRKKPTEILGAVKEPDNSKDTTKDKTVNKPQNAKTPATPSNAPIKPPTNANQINSKTPLKTVPLSTPKPDPGAKTPVSPFGAKKIGATPVNEIKKAEPAKDLKTIPPPVKKDAKPTSEPSKDTKLMETKDDKVKDSDDSSSENSSSDDDSSSSSSESSD